MKRHAVVVRVLNGFRHPLSSTHYPRGFTLVELLVVISVIGVLVTILVPAVNLARESSRKATCQSNLRQFGIGFNIHADLQKGQFCSGAFDWLRDGAVTEIGWVADLVKQGIPVGKMLCPSNVATVSETFNDLMDAPPKEDPCVNRLGSTPKIQPDGTEVTNPCRTIIVNKMAPGSDERRQLVTTEIMLKHFNTNFTASWLFVRSRPILDGSGNVVSRRPGCSNALLTRSATSGPLTQGLLDASNTPASMVPLLGDGTTSGSLAHDLGEHTIGSFVTRTLTSGPLLATSGEKPTFSQGTSRNGPSGWWAVWNKHTRQDYRAFAPVHGGVCNILMADNSVRSFVDENSNGVLDNGLLAESQNAMALSAQELPAQEVFSGAALRGL